VIPLPPFFFFFSPDSSGDTPLFSFSSFFFVLPKPILASFLGFPLIRTTPTGRAILPSSALLPSQVPLELAPQPDRRCHHAHQWHVASVTPLWPIESDRAKGTTKPALAELGRPHLSLAALNKLGTTLPFFSFPAVWAVSRAEPVPSHSWLSFLPCSNCLCALVHGYHSVPVRQSFGPMHLFLGRLCSFYVILVRGVIVVTDPSYCLVGGVVSVPSDNVLDYLV
jgi:hypothetical protein